MPCTRCWEFDCAGDCGYPQSDYEDALVEKFLGDLEPVDLEDDQEHL